MIGIINHLKLELHPAVIPMFLVGSIAFKVWKLFSRLKWSLELTHQLTDLNNVIRDNIAVAKNQFQIDQARLEAERAQRNAQLEAELENQRLQWVEFTQRAEALGQAIKKFRRQCRISQQLKFLKSRQAKLDADAAMREKRRERAFRLAQAAEARQAKEHKEREEIEAAQEQFRLSKAEIKRRKKIEKQAEDDAKHAAAVLAKNSEVKIPVQPELKRDQIVQVCKTTNQVIPVNMAPVLVSDEPAEKPVPGGFICYKSRIWQDLFQNVNNNIPGAIKYYSDAGLAVSFNTSEFEIFYGPIQKMALTRYAPLRGVTVDWFNRAARTISKKPKTPLSGVTGLIGAVAVWPTGKDDKTGWTFSKFNIRTFKSGVFSVSIREDKKEMRLGYYDPRKWIGEPLLLIFDFAFAPQSVSWQKVEPVAIDPLLLQVSSVKDTFKSFVPGAHIIDFLEGRSTEDPFFSGRQIEVPEQEAFLVCEICSEIVDTLIVYEDREICEACMAARLEKQAIEPEESDDDDVILERLMKQAKLQKLQKSAPGPSGTEKSRFNPKLTTVSIAHWEPNTNNSSDLEEEPFEKGW